RIGLGWAVVENDLAANYQIGIALLQRAPRRRWTPMRDGLPSAEAATATAALVQTKRRHPFVDSILRIVIELLEGTVLAALGKYRLFLALISKRCKCRLDSLNGIRRQLWQRRNVGVVECHPVAPHIREVGVGMYRRRQHRLLA